MRSAKVRAQEVIDGLPDDATTQDILYQLYVVGKVEEGDEAIAQGRTVTQEEIERDIERWLHE